MSESILTPASPNIFEDLGYSPQESEYLIIRADLMLKVRAIPSTSAEPQTCGAWLMPCGKFVVNGSDGW